MSKKARRKLNSRSINYIMENNNNNNNNNNDYNDSDVSYTKSNFKNIWFSIIENQNIDDNKLSNNNNNKKNKHDYLQPIISFYQNHRNFDYNEPNKFSRLMHKYPIRSTISSSSSSSTPSTASSSPDPLIDSFESTTSSFISNSYSSLPSSHYDDFNHHKANEFYSIFVSVITAAVFLFFIMYRWFKMNADFRKALNEQIDIQQHQNQQQQRQQNVPPPSTPNTNNYIHMNRSSRMALLPVNRWTHSYSFVIPNNRDELQATAAHLIQQLSNGEYRTARQHQEMIDRARYCLQQLKLHARLTQFQRQQQQQRRANSAQQNNYSTFNNNVSNSYQQRSTLHSDYSPSTSSSLSPLSLTEHSSSDSLCQQQNERDLMPLAPPVSITSLQTVTSLQINESLYNYNNRIGLNSITTTTNNNNRLLNEPPPPAYDTLMIKSCSLPSYSNLNDNIKEKK